MNSTKLGRRLYVSMLVRKWKSPFFVSMFLVLLGIAVYQGITVLISGKTMTNYGIPVSLYISWLGAQLIDKYTYWYFFLGPFVAISYYVVSFARDRSKGYWIQESIMVGRRKAAVIKGAHIFLGSAVTFVLPLMVNFILVAVFRPALLPEPLISIGPSPRFLGCALYYCHPLTYYLLYLLFDGVFVGTLSLAGCLLARIVQNGAASVGILFGIFYLFFLAGGFTDLNDLDPSLFLVPGNGLATPWPVIVTVGMAMVTLIVTVWMGCRDEDL